MPSTELGAPSPRNSKLSKLRRTLGDSNGSSNSLGSSSASEDPNADLSLRPTTSDGVTGKLKKRLRRKSVDDRRGSEDSGKRLSNLIPRRRSKPQNAKNSDSDRQLSVDSSQANLGISNNLSGSSLDLAGSGRSSLLTDGESEHDGKPVRPPLSTHASHVGYLTLSSPEIDSQTQPAVPAGEPPPRADTAPVLGSTISIPQIVEPSETDPNLPTVPDRNSTTTEKLKEAFSLQRKKPVADTDSVTSAGSGFGGLFKSSSRRNSVNPEASVEVSQVREAVGSEAKEDQTSSDTPPATTSQARPETPQNRGRPRVNTASLPQTPPNLTETPTTYVTPPTPTDPNAEFPRRSPKKTPQTRPQTAETTTQVKTETDPDKKQMEALAAYMHSAALEEISRPNMTSLPKLSGARSREVHRQRAATNGSISIMDTDDEDAYVYDTYILAPTTDVGAIQVDEMGGMDNVGYLVITEDDRSLWETYMEEEPSDEISESDEDDENAEGYYGAEYPEDEDLSDSEEGWNRRMWNHRGVPDDEEWDEDTGAYSEDEEKLRAGEMPRRFRHFEMGIREA